LLGHASVTDEALAGLAFFPTHYGASAVTGAAVHSLLQMCSHPGFSKASFPATASALARSTGGLGWGGRGAAGTSLPEEAERRLHALQQTVAHDALAELASLH
jgi:hypothetical protein